MTKKRMVRMVSATEAKNRFGAIIKQAYASDEHLIIERGGIPVVAIVPIQDYERLVAEEELTGQIDEEIARSSKAAVSRARLRAFLASAGQPTPRVPEEEIERDIQEAVDAIRRQT